MSEYNDDVEVLDGEKLGVLKELKAKVPTMTDYEIAEMQLKLRFLGQDLTTEIDTVKEALNLFLTEQYPGYTIKKLSGEVVSQSVLNSQLGKVLNSEKAKRTAKTLKTQKVSEKIDESRFRDILDL